MEIEQESRMRDLNGNVRQIYWFKFLSDFWLVAPVLIPFFKSNLLSLSEVVMVQSVYLTVMLMFTLPAGYLADRFGRHDGCIGGAVAVFVEFFHRGGDGLCGVYPG
jgi:MFS family permease